MNVSFRSDLKLPSKDVFTLSQRLHKFRINKPDDDGPHRDGPDDDHKKKKDAADDCSGDDCQSGWGYNLCCNCEKVLLLLLIVLLVVAFLYAIDGSWLADEIYRAFQYPMVRNARKQGHKV